MFRRREDGSEELINEPGSASEAASPATSATAPSTPAAAAPAAAPSSASTPNQPSFRPVPPQAAMSAASRAAMPSMPQAPSLAAETTRSASPISRPATSTVAVNAKRVLTVGPDIQMKGEITSCDRVVIEGMVDATMRDVHTVELAETGALKGTAEVEDAEISGSFEGDITVRGKLTVYASGRVRGNVTYGEIEIQRGGQISGNIRNAADAKAGQPANSQKKAA